MPSGRVYAGIVSPAGLASALGRVAKRIGGLERLLPGGAASVGLEEPVRADGREYPAGDVRGAWRDLLADVAAGRARSLRARFTYVVREDVVVGRALWREKRATAVSGLTARLSALPSGDLVAFELHQTVRVFPYPQAEARRRVREALRSAAGKIETSMRNIARGDRLARNVRAAVDMCMANAPGLLRRLKDVDERDLRLLVALLLMPHALAPPLDDVSRMLRGQSLRDLHRGVRRRLVGEKGDYALAAEQLPTPESRYTWGFNIEVDYVFTRRGVLALRALIPDETLLRQILEDRGYGEESLL